MLKRVKEKKGKEREGNRKKAKESWGEQPQRENPNGCS
jgi:hypothetical protein